MWPYVHCLLSDCQTFSIAVPQRTWSPTQPRWRSATRRWGATSQSLPTPTMLPTKNCRPDTQRTWTKLWAWCRSFTTDWHLALRTRTRLLPQTKTTTKPRPCSKSAVSNTLLTPANQLLVTHSQFTVHLAERFLLKPARIRYFQKQRICDLQMWFCTNSEVPVQVWKVLF